MSDHHELRVIRTEHIHRSAGTLSTFVGQNVTLALRVSKPLQLRNVSAMTYRTHRTE